MFSLLLTHTGNFHEADSCLNLLMNSGLGMDLRSRTLTYAEAQVQ
jgi:hypothetical protein